jgi:hypothetical protein
VEFNYAKLRGRIIEKFGSQREFSKSLGIPNASFSRKMQGKCLFRQDEMYKMRNLLDIEEDKMADYFFSAKN